MDVVVRARWRRGYNDGSTPASADAPSQGKAETESPGSSAASRYFNGQEVAVNFAAQREVPGPSWLLQARPTMPAGRKDVAAPPERHYSSLPL